MVFGGFCAHNNRFWMGKPPCSRNLRHRHRRCRRHRHYKSTRRNYQIFVRARVYSMCVRCSLYAVRVYGKLRIFPLLRLLRHKNCIICLLGRAFVRSTVAAYTYQLVLCIYIWRWLLCIWGKRCWGHSTRFECQPNEFSSSLIIALDSTHHRFVTI